MGPRSIAARVLTTLAVLALLGALDALIVDRTVLDPARMGRITAAALASPAGSRLVGSQLTAALSRQAGDAGVQLPAGTDRAAQGAVSAVLNDPHGAATVAHALTASYSAILNGGSGGTIPLDLAPLHAALTQQATARNAQAGAALQLAQAPIVRISSGRAGPLIELLARIRRLVHAAPLPLAALGAALLGIALVVGPRRHATLRRAGFGLVLGAGIPALLRFAAPWLAGRAGDEATAAFRRQLVDSAVEGFGPAALFTVAAGLFLLALSVAVRRRY